MKGWEEGVYQTARSIRRRVLGEVLKNNGGYLSQACSSSEILALLYGHLMQLGPSEGPPVPPPFSGVPSRDVSDPPSGASYNGGRAAHVDRFIFSPVHYALTLYATLIEVGRLAPEALAQFNLDGSTVEMIGAEHSPGIEVTAGSLAQALSQAGGIALGRRLKKETGRVWVFMSDGEMQEGQTWEAFAALAFHRIDNLKVMVDVNGQQCDGEMNEVMQVEPLGAKLSAFGAAVSEVDGHDVVAMAEAARMPCPGQVRVVLCRTDPFRDMPPLRSRGLKLHHLRFRDGVERAAYERVYQQLHEESSS